MRALPSIARILGWTLLAAVLADSLLAQGDGAVRWAFTTLGNVQSSPAVGADGTIYFGSQDKYVYAVSPSGNLKWRFLTGDWVDSTPAIGADGTIYVGSWDGKLYALRDNGGSATKLWAYTTGSFIASSPAVAADGTIYIGSGDLQLHAVNPDGSAKWKILTGDWIDSAPAIGADGTIYVGSWDNSIYAITPDGRIKWSFATGGDVVASPALGADGTIYIGSRDRKLYALTPTGQARWEFATGDGIDGSAAVAPDGTIYFGSVDGKVYALNRDGTKRWEYALQQPLYSTPAVRADGAIIVGTSDNAIIALNADGTLKWRTAVGDWLDASPLVAADGSIFIGCYDRKLYALAGNGAPLDSAAPWPAFRRDPVRSGRATPLTVGGSAQLSNVSVRAPAGAGSATLIVGFVIDGSGAKNLLLRSVGPALASFGVASPLGDPRLELFANGVSLAVDDDWGSQASAPSVAAAAATVGAFSLSDGSKDAAITRQLTAGGYTMHTTPATGASGVALVEVYDADSGGGARLANVSARTRVGTGADILITGFVVSGDGARTLLIRGAGPSLGGFGVADALVDPRLRVYRGDTLVAENDDWDQGTDAVQTSATAASVGAFAFAIGSKDSALVLTLPPGAYTAQVSGVNDTTGVALVEVYEVR